MLSAAVVLGSTAAAMAQTTITINDPQKVVFATLRSGRYTNTNIDDRLETRSAPSGDSYLRRALLKFDTQNTIPKGATVTSATMTVSIKNAGRDGSRRIGAYQVRTSWTEDETTWKLRRKGQNWTTPGGDLGTLLDTVTVGNSLGEKATFDVTALVKQAVAGKLGSSRYTRIALVDRDSATTDSYRLYYSPRDSNTSRRPVLKVTYTTSGSSTQTSTSGSSTSGSGSTLRVLHWNTHHNGVGTDGKLNPDRLMTWVARFKPDVVSMNEVERYTGYGNFDGPVVLRDLLEKKTGRNWYYKFQTASGNSKGNGNLILSRFPFDSTDTKLLSYTRSVVNATIHVNGRRINFYSTHLDAESSSRQQTQVSQITSWAAGQSEQRIIAGDFNAWQSTTTISKMRSNYKDSWAVATANGTEIGYPGNESGKTRNSRIDFIFYSENATQLRVKSSQVPDTRDSNGVMPSDHRPVLTVFEVR